MSLIPSIRLPRISNHGSEIILLGVMACGIIALIWRAIEKGVVGTGNTGFDVTAFLLVLQRIVEAVQKRWEQRGQDAKDMQLAHSAPVPFDQPTGTERDPIRTQEV